ncbi:hypothetical protein CBS101457_003382 [Exobasidium rhododendri]|nr:hypothetical protein CBS101457_003382 [Exobasidium rhododendri]
MAVNAASNAAQKAMGDEPTTTTSKHTDLTQEEASSKGETMMALTWQGKEKVEMKEMPKPKIMDENDALIKVTGSTVCGSDLHLLHGDILQLVPDDILGHEGMGVVESVGSNVKKIKVGDRVVASFSISCGFCKFCKEKLGSMCENTNSSSVMKTLYGQNFSGLLGYGHFAGSYSGAQAEYFRAPYADNNLLKIPDGVSDEKAMFLSDIVCTSYHSVVDIDFKEGNTAAIWGAGPVGLNIAQWLKRVFKAKRVVIIDTVQNRLDFAKEKIGVEILNRDTDCPEGVVKKLYEMEPTGWDACFDVAGFRYAQSLMHKAMRAMALETDSPEILNECIVATRKHGRISIAADYAGLANGFNIGALMEKGIMLKGNGQAPAQLYMEKILNDYIIPEKFDPTLILTHRFDLSEMDKLYHAFDQKLFDGEKGVGILKTFVQTKFSNPPGPGMPALSKVPTPK